MRDERVAAAWAALQERTEAFIRRVENLGETERQRRPGPKDFNAIEVVDHMGLVEDFYVPKLRRADWQRQRGQRPRPNFLYGRVTATLRKAGPIPTFGSMTPKAAVELERVVSHWRELRREFEALILDCPPDSTFLRHHLFGRLGPLHFINLLDAHLEYHEKRFPVQS